MTGPPEKFVREQLAEGGYEDIADPHELADILAKALTNSELRELAAALLIPIVRDVIRRQRKSTRVAKRPSSRWDSARFAHEVLARREYVGGDWKFLGECSPSEVMQIVALHETQAGQSIAAAREYRRIADKGKALKVKTISEIPPEVLAYLIADPESNGH